MASDTDGTVAGRPRLLRTINEQNVLNAIRRNGQLSRRELTTLSGLSKPTVGLTLANLTTAGLVRVAGRRSSLRGPTALLYEIRPDAGLVLSLDVGTEYLRGAVADISGGVRSRSTRSVHGASGQARSACLLTLADDLIAEAGASWDGITQTVLGSPGVYAPGQRIPSGLPSRSGWRRPGGGQAPVPVMKLDSAFGAGAIVENDVNLAALAERRHGHGQTVESFVFISVGTGIGMALVVNGQLHTGAHGAAGEIGFMPVPEPAASKPASSGDGRRSTTLEARASAAGVVRLARQLGMRGALTARRVFEAAAKGDPRAVEVVAAEVEAIAGAIAATAAVADPELVVLGGGIGRADGFAAAVGVELARLIPVPPDIRVSALGDEAIVEGGLVAGLDLAWDKILDRT